MENIIKLFSLLLLMNLFHSCDMPLQTDYDYDASVIDPHVEMTAWEFLQTRPELFTTFVDAVEYTGLEKYYKQNDSLYTFLVLTEKAMIAYMKSVNPSAISIEDCDKQRVTEMIKYHIIEGRYSTHYNELEAEPMFVPTLLRNEKGLMTMLVRKSPWNKLVGKVVVNDAGSNGNSPYRQARTSNILPTNGVIHVFDSYNYYAK